MMGAASNEYTPAAWILVNNDFLRAATIGKEIGSIVFGGEAARRAGEFNDNLTRVNASFTATKMALASDVLPTLNEYLAQLIKGREIAGSFGAAILTFGTMNPFRSGAH